MKRKCHHYLTLYEAARAVIRIYAGTECLPLDTKRVIWWLGTMKRQFDFPCDELEKRVPQVLSRLQEDDQARYEMGTWRPMPGKIDDFGNVVDEFEPVKWRGL